MCMWSRCGAALVEVAFALDVQQVQFVHQAVAFQQAQGAIDGDAIDTGIDPGGAAEDLGGIEMLVSGFNDFQDDAALPGHAHAAAEQGGLQGLGYCGFGHRHRALHLSCSMLQPCCNEFYAKS